MWAFSGLVALTPAAALDTSEAPLLPTPIRVTAGGPAGTEEMPQAWALTSGDSLLDARSNPGQAILRNTGAALNLSPSDHLGLSGGLYYSKRLSFLDATANRSSLDRQYQLAMPFAPSGQGRERALNQGRALYQRVDYKAGKLALTGSYQDVDESFEALSSLTQKDELARRLAGQRGLQSSTLGLKYEMRPGMALSADYGNIASGSGSAKTNASYQKLDAKLGRLALTGNLSSVDLNFTASKDQLAGDSQLRGLYQLRGLDTRQFGLSYDLGAGKSLSGEFANLASSFGGGSHDAVYQKIDAKLGRLSFSANLTDVAAGFGANKDQLDGNSQLKALAASQGIATKQLNLGYNGGRLSLSSSYNQVANNQAGHKDAGTTRTETRNELKAQLGRATNVGLSLATMKLTGNAGGNLLSSTETSTMSVSHRFSKSLAASIVKELVDSTNGGQQVSSDATSLHLEYKPGAALALSMDTKDKSYSNGVKETLRQLNFYTAVGQGLSRFALKGELRDVTSGQGGAQKEQGSKLSLTAGGSPKLGLTVDWQTLRQDGPSATRDYEKLSGKLGSQLAPWAKLSASFNDETEMGDLSRADRSYKVELTPKRFSLTLGQDQLELRDKPTATTSYGSLAWKFGKPLAPWAKELSAGGPFGDLYRYGFARMPGWAKIPDAGLGYSLLSRRTEGEQAALNTQVLGFNRMIGGRVYLRLAMEENPLDDKNNIVRVKHSIYELGARIGGRGSLVVRSLSEQNTTNGQQVDTLSAIAQTKVGKRLDLAGGYQSSEATDGTATGMMYAGVAWRFSKPLAAWANEASESGVLTLFPDAATYGWQKLPAWKLLPAEGLYFQLTARDNEQGQAKDSRLIGYQGMLGKRAYIKLCLQQNPLDEKNNLVVADRQLIELGGRLLGKVTLFGRLVQDKVADGGTTSRVLGMFGQLSSKEKVSTVLIFDSSNYPGADYSGTTLGVEYSREIADDHYIVLKATSTKNGKPGLPAAQADSYRFDVAYKKDI